MVALNCRRNEACPAGTPGYMDRQKVWVHLALACVRRNCESGGNVWRSVNYTGRYGRVCVGTNTTITVRAGDGGNDGTTGAASTNQRTRQERPVNNDGRKKPFVTFSKMEIF